MTRRTGARPLFLDSATCTDLKRFSEARRTSKLSTFVNFPMKDLDLREVSSESSSKASSVWQHQRGEARLLRVPGS